MPTDKTETEQAAWTPERIREIRQAHGMTQTEMAARIGVHLVTYQHWEGGDAYSHPRKPGGSARKMLAILEREAEETRPIPHK